MKIDFARAYDCVNWGFLLDLFSKFGFGDKWCAWINECISSVSMSILINRSATKEFKLQKGLRQGDLSLSIPFQYCGGRAKHFVGKSKEAKYYKRD